MPGQESSGKRYKVGAIERLAASVLRWIAFRTGSTFDEPGPHVCFRCSLYDPGEGVCRVAVFRPNAPVDPATGKRYPELRRVFPFDPCVRQYDKKMGALKVFDIDEMRREAEIARRLKEEAAQQAMLRSIGTSKNLEERDEEEQEACTDVQTANTKRTTRQA